MKQESINNETLEINKEVNKIHEDKLSPTKPKKGIMNLTKELCYIFNQAAGAAKSLIILGIFVLILCFAYSAYNTVSSIVKGIKGEVKITSTLVGNYIKESRELITYKYFYTNATMMEESGWFKGKKLIVAYDGKALIGVDLEHLHITVSDDTKTIKIANLGKAKILSNVIDDHSMRIFDESTSLFAEWKLSDFREFFAKERKEVEEKILASELMQEARIASEDAIIKLLMLNSQFADYKIEFIDEPTLPAPASK